MTKEYKYPNIALRITVNHRTRDMSVAINYSDVIDIPAEELVDGNKITGRIPLVGTLEILSVKPEHIDILCDDIPFSLDFGQTMSSKEFQNSNPYLSVDNATISMEYADFSDYGHTMKIVYGVGEYHDRLLRIGMFSLPEKIVEEQKEALHNLSGLCADGDISLYPLLALLSASDNWATYRIVRPDQFREILLEGIDKGCLSPDVDYAWHVLETATINNDPAGFMDDMERYYDILATAAGEGNSIALDMMNRIWEPEQIIEED